MEDCEVLAALAAVVIDHVSGISVHELSRVMTVFLRVWFVDDAVLDATAGEALRRDAELHAEELSKLLWSVLAGARRSSDAAVLQVSGKVECFVDLAEEILLKEAGLRDPESLSSAVSIFRKLSHLQTALSLHDQLLGVCGSAPRRERFRLQFSKEEGYPLQIACGALLMEAERREDVALSVRLFESLARSVRSAWRLLEHIRYALDYIQAVTEVEAKRPLHKNAPRCFQVSSWR